MEDLVDASLFPDENGVLDLQDKHWVTLDEVVWTYAHTLLVLNVAHNQLVHIPDAVGNLELLRELLMANNRIASVSLHIARCVNLRKFDLCHNQLVELPSNLQYCKSLEELNVSYNELTTLPSELGQLQHLRILNVSHNRLTLLPHTLCNCSALEDVNCEGNDELVDIPESIRSNTKLVLWICGTMKRHRAEMAELIGINRDLELMARLRDEESLKLHEKLATLERTRQQLEDERPHNYLHVKKHVVQVTSEVCNLM